MPKPLPLKEEEIKALERRVKERWQIHRGDMEALFEMARGYNAFVAGGAALPQSGNAPLLHQMQSIGGWPVVGTGTGMPTP